MLSAKFTDLGKRGRYGLHVAWAGHEDTISFCFFLKERWTQTWLNGAPGGRVQTCDSTSPAGLEGVFRAPLRVSQSRQGPIWWKGPCGRSAYSRDIRRCSEGWWVKTGWTHPVDIFRRQFTGPGTFLFHRAGQIQHRVPLSSFVAGPTFRCQSLFPSCGGQPTPRPALSSCPPHGSDSLSPAKVCGTHRLTPSCAVLIFWTTAQGSSCWFVWFLEDTVSSKSEVGQLSLKNPSGNINILGLHVKRENSRILSGGYIQLFGASSVALVVENLPAIWETWVPFLGWEDLLEEEMATPSIAWRIPMERGARRAIVHVVAKSQKWLSN